MGLVPLQRRPQRVPDSTCHVRTQRETAVHGPEQGSHQSLTIVAPDLGCVASRAVKNKFLLFTGHHIYGSLN